MNVEFARELDAEDCVVAIQIELAVDDEFLQRDDLLFFLRINPADERREPAIFELHDHRPLHVWRSRDHAWRIADLDREIAPIVEHGLRCDQNVGVKIDHLLPQLAIEPSHD